MSLQTGNQNGYENWLMTTPKYGLDRQSDWLIFMSVLISCLQRH